VRLNFVLSFVKFFLILIIFISSAYASEDIVEKIEINGLSSISKKEFLYLMGIEENKKLNREEINRGIKRVFLKNVFEDIRVEIDNKVLRIAVKEKPIIEEIKISGNIHFSEKFYKNLLLFNRGDRLNEIQLNKTKKKIEEELKKRGYLNGKIRVDKIQKGERLNIELIVDEGSPIIIKSIKWEGSVDEHIKAFLKLQPNDPFDKVALEDFIQRAREYLQKQGLIGSDIKYSFKDSELTIFVQQGIRVKVEIKGNESLSTGELKNIIMAHFQDRVNEEIIKDTVNSLISFYKLRGFPEVKVVPLIQQETSIWEITYFIAEGGQKIIEKVTFDKTSLREDELKVILFNKEGAPFNYDELLNDRQRIEDFFRSKGYYAVKVYQPEAKEVEENKMHITFKIEENKAVKIKSIELSVFDDFLKEEINTLIDNYKERLFSDAVFFEIKRKIREIYLKNGYPQTLIDGKYEIKEDKAFIYIHVNKGSKKVFGRSIILGNNKTKTDFIYKRLLSKEEQPYNPYIIDSERQSLYKTGLFSKIDINVEPYDDSIDLIYQLEENPAGAFEFGFGYGEYERAKGFLELSYINLFGMNKQIFSRAELSSIEHRTYVTYVDPWIWKDLTYKLSLIYEKIDVKNIDTKEIIYKLQRYGLSTGFEKKFLDYFKAELLYEVNYSKTWDVMPEVVITDKDIGKIFISGFKGSLIYDTRDNVFDPKKGWLIGVTSKISNKFLGSEINFLKTSFYLNKYTELTPGLVLANSIRAGWAWLYGDSKDLPISERYFMGGRDTVRGYAQNTLGPKKDGEPTGGNAFLIGNIELRTHLGKNFYLINFLDFGNVWSRVGEVSLSSLKYTAGIGLRYKTPVGPIRIDYGHKLNREKGESRGEIHFSIGHAF